MSNKGTHTLILALVSAMLALSACSPAVGQGDAAQAETKREEKKDDKKGAVPEGKPVLWREPADMPSRDLLVGPGGEGMKPDLSQVVWEATEDEGYSVKWRVRDGSGKKWVV